MSRAPRSTASALAVAGGLPAALMLLTRLPVGGATSPLSRRWASAWFPVVGALLGGAAALTQAGLAPRLGTTLAAVVGVALLALLTGALHEDGLADSADALGGARDRAQIFVILKDSRHGTYGVLALIFSVLLRVGALAGLGADAPVALGLAVLLARASLVALLWALPYVTPAGVARSADVAHAGAAQTVLAAVFTLALGAGVLRAGLLPLSAVGLAALVAALVSGLAGWRFHVRAGGITGDFLGANAQLVEAAVLLALLAGPR